MKIAKLQKIVSEQERKKLYNSEFKCFVSGWNQISNRACNTQHAEPECYNNCPQVYAPVCGQSGKKQDTFSSSCVLDYINCKDTPENRK